MYVDLKISFDSPHLVKHTPLEDATIMMSISVNRPIFECLVIDPIDYWNTHDRGIAIDGSQKWRQPILVHFTMCIEVHNNFTGRLSCAPRSRTNQSLTFTISYDSYLNLNRYNHHKLLHIFTILYTHLAVELLNVAVKFVLKIFFITKVVNEEDFMEKLSRRSIDDRMNCPHEYGKAFVVENDLKK